MMLFFIIPNWISSSSDATVDVFQTGRNLFWCNILNRIMKKFSAQKTRPAQIKPIYAE